jgi:hypothetical protein
MSFVARQFGRVGGAKLTEFRPGGGAKLSLGGAKFVARIRAQSKRQSQLPGPTGAAMLPGQSFRVRVSEKLAYVKASCS